MPEASKPAKESSKAQESLPVEYNGPDLQSEGGVSQPPIPTASTEANSVLAQELEKVTAENQQLKATGQADRLKILQLEEKVAAGIYI